MKFQFLSHTADIRMKVEARTLPLLFQVSLKGMSQILKENHCSPDREYEIKKITTIKAPDVTCLLIDFLSEALTFSFTNKAVFCKAAFIEFSEQELSAEISGSRIKSFNEEIKAVTYHEADIKRNIAGLWETVIVFDI